MEACALDVVEDTSGSVEDSREEVEVVNGEDGEGSEGGDLDQLLLLLGGTCDDHLVEDVADTSHVA